MSFSNSNCQCKLFSRKNPISRVFRISGCLAVPINPDKRSSTVPDNSASRLTRFYSQRAINVVAIRRVVWFFFSSLVQIRAVAPVTSLDKSKRVSVVVSFHTFS